MCRFIFVAFVMIGIVFRFSISQIIQVVEVKPNPPGISRPTLAPNPNYSTENPVIFEFLRPRGLGISIPGPYPPSNRYVLKFHLNINKEFSGWKRGEWNEGVIIPRGRKWSYVFPNIQVKQGDIIYYWIEAEGNDWEKGFKGKHQVTEPAPHGVQLPSTDEASGPCSLWSSTTYSGGRKACASERLIKSYSQVAQKYLRKESPIFMRSVKQIGGLEPEEKFTVFTNDFVLMNSTHTAFVPTMLEARYGPSAVNAKNFTLSGCTSNLAEQCSASAMAYLILPPVLSGRHTSELSFSFRFGIIEVTAKMPRGDWIVPELWLMPKDQVYGNSSGRIVLAMSRGNDKLTDGVENFSNRVLEAGIQTRYGGKMFRKVQNKPWTSEYHKFKLIWTPDKMEFLVDEQEIGEILPNEQGVDQSLHGSNLALFNQEFYLMFGVHVGGDRDFSDSLIGKPWKNHEPKNKLKFWEAHDDWLSTWGVDSALIIKGLSVVAL